MPNVSMESLSGWGKWEKVGGYTYFLTNLPIFSPCLIPFLSCSTKNQYLCFFMPSRFLPDKWACFAWYHTPAFMSLYNFLSSHHPTFCVLTFVNTSCSLLNLFLFNLSLMFISFYFFILMEFGKNWHGMHISIILYLTRSPLAMF